MKTHQSVVDFHAMGSLSFSVSPRVQSFQLRSQPWHAQCLYFPSCFWFSSLILRIIPSHSRSSLWSELPASVLARFCPVYKLAIYPDGSVVFDAKEHVRVKEVQNYQIDAAAVQALIAKFQAAHYFSLAPAYTHITMPDGTEMMVTDLPTTYTSLSLDGRTKKVEDYVGAPKELGQLEARTAGR